jgi:hypothetical protein
LKGAIYSIHAKRKNNYKEKKMFTLSNERVIGKNKVKCPTPKSRVGVILKNCQMSMPIKY